MKVNATNCEKSGCRNICGEELIFLCYSGINNFMFIYN